MRTTLAVVFLLCAGAEVSYAQSASDTSQPINSTLIEKLWPLNLAGDTSQSTINSTSFNCESYKGQDLTAKTLSQFLAKVSSKELIKSEFETTATFMTRVAKIIDSERGADAVWVPVNYKEIAYDADKQTLSVRLAAITNGSTDYSTVFGSSDTQRLPLNISTSRNGDNVQLLIQSPRVRVGTYQGETATGVQFTITEYMFDTKALLERRSADLGENLVFSNWQATEFHEHNAITIEGVSPDLAKILKPTLKVAVIVTAKPPFYARGVAPSDYAATFRPYVVDESLEVATVDFKCLLLTDGEGVVLGTVNTR